MMILGEEVCKGDVVSIKLNDKRNSLTQNEVFFVERCRNEFLILNNYLYSISIHRANIKSIKIISRGKKYMKKLKILKEREDGL